MDASPLWTLSCPAKQQSAALQAYDENVQELNRLRWVHETSQMQHITTLAWQAKQEAMLQSVKHSQDRVASLQVGPCIALVMHLRL